VYANPNRTAFFGLALVMVFTVLTRKQKEIKQYTTTHGLPNNVVHGIMEDSYGYLWLSTDKGLSRFQPQTEKLPKSIQVMTVYRAINSPTKLFATHVTA